MEKKYLIGRAEQLTDPVPPKRGGPPKVGVYTYEESRVRLSNQLQEVLTIPPKAMVEPDGVRILKFALHPDYLAKSYYPSRLLRSMGFDAVGSRSVHKEADPDVKKYEDKEFITSEIFVAATLEQYQDFLDRLNDSGEDHPELSDITKIQEISLFESEEKIKPGDSRKGAYEVVLHLPNSDLSPQNRQKFLEFLSHLGGEAETRLSVETGRLWFLPVHIEPDKVKRLAEYSTLRVIRPMPGIAVSPIRSLKVPQTLTLPTPPDHQSGPKVAILDGGLPEGSTLHGWVDQYVEMNPRAAGVREYEEHGHAVCSAFLFGPLSATQSLTPPTQARVDVVRVLDEETQADDAYELFTVLGYIQEVLLSGIYSYINLSLGPALPVEDDDVHAWTSLIDGLLDDGRTLMTVAAGNNGGKDRESGNARIQVPADAVNAISVGSCDRTTSDWKRASYSALGPGRFPGRIKPDVLAFGGSEVESFNIVSPSKSSVLIPVMGTSFAAPFALRKAVQIKNLFEDQLSPLAIKNLLIHGAEPSVIANRDEEGWGRLPLDVESMVSGGTGTARIVYQGFLMPGKYLRAQIPMPAEGYEGWVKVSATFCFATPTDPQNPDVYTRSALDITFRRNQKEEEERSKPTGFFTSKEFATESQLRKDEGKWENVLHQTKRLRGDTLLNPVFDIHYNARFAGGPPISDKNSKMQYALVITIEANKHIDLHDNLLASYPDLVAFEPQITTPVVAEINQNIQ